VPAPAPCICAFARVARTLERSGQPRLGHLTARLGGTGALPPQSGTQVGHRPPVQADLRLRLDLAERCDRAAVEALMTLEFLDDASNVVLVGPNGVGKSMLAQNITHQAVIRGHTVLFTSAGQLLSDHLMFELISRRYQSKSTMITTNRPVCRVARSVSQRRLRHGCTFTAGGRLHDLTKGKLKQACRHRHLYADFRRH
jgi:hypothetical protein